MKIEEFKKFHNALAKKIEEKNCDTMPSKDYSNGYNEAIRQVNQSILELGKFIEEIKHYGFD